MNWKRKKPPKPQKGSKERRLRTAVGTVIVKGRRTLTDDDVLGALREAISCIEQQQRAAA